jgi:transcriptional regulator with XRE-family HTH domain
MGYHPVEQVLRQRERSIRWLAAKVGVSDTLLWRVLRGQRRARPELRRRVAEVLELPEALLFPEVDP